MDLLHARQPSTTAGNFVSALRARRFAAGSSASFVVKGARRPLSLAARAIHPCEKPLRGFSSTTAGEISGSSARKYCPSINRRASLGRVAELRSRVGVDEATPPLRLTNFLLFVAALVAGLVIGLLGLVLVLLFLPLGLLTFASRRRRG